MWEVCIDPMDVSGLVALGDTVGSCDCDPCSWPAEDPPAETDCPPGEILICYVPLDEGGDLDYSRKYDTCVTIGAGDSYVRHDLWYGGCFW